MSVTIQTLLNSTSSLYRLKLIAGTEGTSRSVSWMYYSEDTSTLDFLRGGELVITTGMEIGRRAENLGVNQDDYIVEYLSKLIEVLSQENASGLILNVGKYIVSVPREIIELCNRLQFALMTMPWEIHIIDIMQDYANRFISDRQKTLSLEQTIFDAMFAPSKFNPLQLENTSFANATEYSVILVDMPEKIQKMSQEDLAYYMNYSFNIKLGVPASEYVAFPYKTKIVYAFHSNAHNYIAKIEKALKKDTNFGQVRISISGTCNRIQEISAEYEHAMLAMNFCNSQNLLGDYDKLGIYQILGEVKDRKILEDFYQRTLGELNFLGKEKLDDYLNTLKLYIESSGMVSKTAQENSTHRNTVNYRIRKICDILNIDLSDGKTRYMIQTALYIRELLAM